VPLSEHEQRQLEQIEQALYAEHPRFARAVRAADPQVHYRRRILYAAIGFVLGLALLPVGVAISSILVSVLGFVVMLACSYWATSSYRRMDGIVSGRIGLRHRRLRRQARAGRPGRGGPGRPARPGRRPGGGLGERLEERWRRRQEGRGF